MRLPNSRTLGLEAAGVALGEQGAIAVDKFSRSSVENIYAVGDVTDRVNGKAMRGHRRDPESENGANGDEDQTCADAKDDTCSLKNSDSVGVVHPLHLTEEQRAAWGEIFSDYAIVPPFAQQGRPIHRLDKGEQREKENSF